ncbi:DUF2179 domain-containing protein [Paenibacillus sp. LMG 31458]|uniref:UPF0316 protein GC098_26900 n=1 Tax=Paenibacillus phytorum TaxID=2654977 RepID=A0ABX1Y2D8_9BACL|nr:DUF2179 domain-containing protein [Paenibacillus phytorum]NOU74973.1 DUF2179 domain-containing protein [Paenibacillus phytorum]
MWTLVAIFFIQVIYVSSLTTRMILTIRGYRYFAALLSMVDIMVYTIGLKIVLDNLSKPISLVVYCVSYGIGILVGMKLEEKLALGYINVQVIPSSREISLSSILRGKGYGITQWMGEGMDGERVLLSITMQRRNQSQLLQEIENVDPHAFVVTHDIKQYRGGFFAGQLGGNKK